MICPTFVSLIGLVYGALFQERGDFFFYHNSEVSVI